MNVEQFHTTLSELLGLTIPPVGVAFRRAAPAGVPRVDRPGPAGCAYWRDAAEGRVFYTEAGDHYNCPVGAHTHGVALPPERAEELQQVVGTMVGLKYIRMEEVATLPRRTEPFGVAVYGPLGAMPVDPDVVIVRGTARQIMLVAEAARAAGIGADGATMGRPACAMIPEALRSARGNMSLGCIGNRVYTELGDTELYFTIPGSALGDVVVRLVAIVHANRELERYHEGRRATLCEAL
jgi:uncharacterized protein (DUF169 family)